MRTLIYQAIINDPTMNGFGITGPTSFSVDVDTPITRPFLQLRWGVNAIGLDVSTQRSLVIWVHDQPGDYTRIDSIILRLRALISSLVPSRDTQGWLQGAVWEGDSEDLTDVGHGTIARNTSFTLVGSGQ